MTFHQQLSTKAHSSGIRVWRHGELPMPDWIPQHMAGGIESNGTFPLETDRGCVRVHPGNIVVERCGTVWVCPSDEVDDFIANLELASGPTHTNIGPGKVRQFGTRERQKGKARSKYTESNDRPPRQAVRAPCARRGRATHEP